MGVFFISQIVPQSSDERFYLINSSWSLLVIFCVMSIQRTKTVIAITIIESTMTIINLATCIDYVSGKGFLYGAYVAIINAMNAAEAVVLMIGAPWLGAYKRLAAIISNMPFVRKRYNRHISNDSSSTAKEASKKGGRCR